MTRARDLSNLIGSGNYTSTTFTATAGQTVFTIAHTQGFIQVFMNGLLLDETTDYTSNGTAVTLTEAATAGDELEVVKYNTFSVGDAITQTDADTRYVNVTGDTMTGTLNATGIARNTNGLRIGASNASTGYGLRIGASGATDPLEIWRDHANGDQMQLSVDYYGRVTMPYQLHISGTPNNSGGNGLANAFYPYNTPVGLSFSNSRITVPIAGNYMICWNTIGDAGTGRVDTYIRVNGSQLTNGMGDSNHTDFRYRGNAIVVRLAANDYIQFEHQDYYNSPLTSFNNWNHASVTLLG